MKKLPGLLLFLFTALSTQAQYKVRFVLKEQTAIHHDSIFITGTFSSWDSTANKEFLLLPLAASNKSITFNLKAGIIRYKFHRGSWLSVEKQDNGDEVPDRKVTINKDTPLPDSVLRWRDEMFVDKWYALAKEKEDTGRLKILASIAYAYGFYNEYYNADSALLYAQAALQLQQKIMASSNNKLSPVSGYTTRLITLQEVVASLMHSFGNYPKALELRLENLKLAEKESDKFLLVMATINIANDYMAMKDYQHVLSYGKSADSILSQLNPADSRFSVIKWNTNSSIIAAFYNLQLPDSALPYANAMKRIKGLPFVQAYEASTNRLLADIYAAKGDNKSALDFYRLAIPNSSAFWAAPANVGMAKVFQKTGHLDSALVYARKALTFYQTQKITIQSWGENSNYFIAEISPLIADLYNANGQLDSAYKYLHLSVLLKDSLYNSGKVRQFQTLSFNEASRRQQLEQQRKEAQDQYQTKIKMYGLISIITGFIVLAFVLYRNNKQKQKANTILQNQKQEIETTLGELKTTQKQLIQSEKMASLGELTAGIAHEIQNPLNFINNFSEVNKELITEMREAIDHGNYDEVKIIAGDIEQNEEKINHHGKRADGIVKGMLQHSRTNNGQKESANINTLADEYLRLAYHGLRAKDKSFNATLQTDFDNSVGSVSMIPQDIGRVLLNLINNAFYAATLPSKAGFSDANYKHEPTVWLSTKKTGNKVLISVRDNGPGIPQNIVDKIFQPFFTTKPTGQGTGLGLSLSYDIIKAHGGDIRVETKEGEGATFIISIPVKNE
ncbi:hypothetical protein BH11BAC5_BH11BAC5_32320 [soil metagenome]